MDVWLVKSIYTTVCCLRAFFAAGIRLKKLPMPMPMDNLGTLAYPLPPTRVLV
jgi:hypothetical protein